MATNSPTGIDIKQDTRAIIIVPDIKTNMLYVGTLKSGFQEVPLNKLKKLISLKNPDPSIKSKTTIHIVTRTDIKAHTFKIVFIIFSFIKVTTS